METYTLIAKRQMSLWLVSIVLRLLPNLTFKLRHKQLLLKEEYVEFVHNPKKLFTIHRQLHFFYRHS